MEQSFSHDDALVLASGGQDSTTCMFWAMANFKSVRAISFLYGQKHAAEVDTAGRICSRYGIEHKTVDLSFLAGLAVSHLFAGEGEIGESRHPLDPAVPSSFVPYRNLLFLVVASVWASTLRTRHIVAGMCEADSSGYADCRDVFVKASQSALNLATDFKETGVVVHTPLMWLSKAETFRLAETLQCLDVVLRDTITCYNGSNEMREYGRGCGTCPACLLRSRGYAEYIRKYHSPGVRT